MNMTFAKKVQGKGSLWFIADCRFEQSFWSHLALKVNAVMSVLENGFFQKDTDLKAELPNNEFVSDSNSEI